jgi:hypothetical protein
MRGSRWPVASQDSDFAGYLTGRPAASTEMFWRFAGLARSCGPVTFELQRGPIVLCGSRRIFASVRVTEHGLQGHLNLARQLAADRRIRKAEPFTKRLFYHAYAVGSLADLDEEFGMWLCEARAIGDGAHLASGL